MLLDYVAFPDGTKDIYRYENDLIVGIHTVDRQGATIRNSQISYDGQNRITEINHRGKRYFLTYLPGDTVRIRNSFSSFPVDYIVKNGVISSVTTYTIGFGDTTPDVRCGYAYNNGQLSYMGLTHHCCYGQKPYLRNRSFQVTRSGNAKNPFYNHPLRFTTYYNTLYVAQLDVQEYYTFQTVVGPSPKFETIYGYDKGYITAEYNANGEWLWYAHLKPKG